MLVLLADNTSHPPGFKLQSAIFALPGSAVPKPVLRDVNPPIIFLLLHQSSNNFSVIGIIEKLLDFGWYKLASRN